MKQARLSKLVAEKAEREALELAQVRMKLTVCKNCGHDYKTPGRLSQHMVESNCWNRTVGKAQRTAAQNAENDARNNRKARIDPKHPSLGRVPKHSLLGRLMFGDDD